MNIEQRIYDGNRAREILENPVFAEALKAIQEEITEQWKQTPARDVEGREKMWLMLKISEKFEATIRSTLETGKLAELELKHQQTLLERAKEWIG